MATGDFLQVYDLKITTASPLFIGDGRTILKNGYLHDPLEARVTVFEDEKLFELLIKENKVDEYEQFMLGRQGSLAFFLKNICHFIPEDWAFAVRYTVDARNALDRGHSLKDIHTFIRDAYGRVYVPGSSVKGALRTVLLNQMILADSADREEYNPRRFDVTLGVRYLHTLHIKKNKPSSLGNSIMRGIQISDSASIPDTAMMLAMKSDARVDGTFSAGRGIVCRESIRPGTKIHLKLTLDQSILKGRVTKDSILAAIRGFDTYYQATYASHFVKPKDTAEVPYVNRLRLGGGSGFFSKSLVYPYLGEEKGMEVTAEMMQRNFRRHRHDKDIEKYHISPHTMEYAKYQGKYYPMGVCEVEIQ